MFFLIAGLMAASAHAQDVPKNPSNLNCLVAARATQGLKTFDADIAADGTAEIDLTAKLGPESSADVFLRNFNSISIAGRDAKTNMTFATGAQLGMAMLMVQSTSEGEVLSVTCYVQ